MPAPINPFKRALSAGEMQFGCWVALADTFSAELMGQAGFDWLVIDGEHAPNDLRSIMAQLQVIEGSDAHAVWFCMNVPFSLKRFQGYPR